MNEGLIDLSYSARVPISAGGDWDDEYCQRAMSTFFERRPALDTRNIPGSEDERRWREARTDYVPSILSEEDRTGGNTYANGINGIRRQPRELTATESPTSRRSRKSAISWNASALARGDDGRRCLPDIAPHRSRERIVPRGSSPIIQTPQFKSLIRLVPVLPSIGTTLLGTILAVAGQYSGSRRRRIQLGGIACLGHSGDIAQPLSVLKRR